MVASDELVARATSESAPNLSATLARSRLASDGKTRLLERRRSNIDRWASGAGVTRSQRKLATRLVAVAVQPSGRSWRVPMGGPS